MKFDPSAVVKKLQSERELALRYIHITYIQSARSGQSVRVDHAKFLQVTYVKASLKEAFDCSIRNFVIAAGEAVPTALRSKEIAPTRFGDCSFGGDHSIAIG